MKIYYDFIRRQTHHECRKKKSYIQKFFQQVLIKMFRFIKFVFYVQQNWSKNKICRSANSVINLPSSYFTFKMLIKPQVVARRVLWNRVCPLFCLPVHLLIHPPFDVSTGPLFFFLNFGMVLETDMKLYVTARFYFKKIASKIRKMGQKLGFFLKLVFNESLYYLLYSYTNPLFGKVWFLRYGLKWSWPIRSQYF